MHINQNLQIFPSQTSSNESPTRMTIIDQISPIKEIIPLYLNRPSQNQSRKNSKEKPQLITSKSQASIKIQSNKIIQQSLKAKNFQEPKNNIAQAITLLDSLKLKYDNVLESKIETIICILRAQFFDKENYTPNLELLQQISSLQSTNKTLLNELQLKKSQISDLQQMIDKFNIQIKHLSQITNDLQQNNFELQQQLKFKEKQNANSSQFQQLDCSLNIEVYPQIQSDQNIYYQNKVQIDLRQRFDQVVIPNQRKDQDLLLKVNGNKQLQNQTDITIINKKHQEIKQKK
ncbi:unnamed protein product [Paramecium sonneborni]|uniref:Uncharacterized protein n=1 Tax=Paramecium sonneborni TaxID=65129 RepID=A0A8S1KCD5_9CILI|nr:unnamed protein product [Paramecium sonneborni]